MSAETKSSDVSVMKTWKTYRTADIFPVTKDGALDDKDVSIHKVCSWRESEEMCSRISLTDKLPPHKFIVDIAVNGVRLMECPDLRVRCLLVFEAKPFDVVYKSTTVFSPFLYTWNWDYGETSWKIRCPFDKATIDVFYLREFCFDHVSTEFDRGTYNTAPRASTLVASELIDLIEILDDEVVLKRMMASNPIARHLIRAKIDKLTKTSKQKDGWILLGKER